MEAAISEATIEFSHAPAGSVLLIAGLAVGFVLLWSYGRARRGSGNGWERAVLPLLRLMSVAVVVLCLLNPQKVQVIEHRQNGRLAILLDTSRSMGVNDVPGTRLTLAKSWLRDKVIPAVPQEAAVSLYSFDQSLTPLPDLTLVSPTGGSTSIGDALDQLLLQQGQDPLMGVILCSDGIENSGGDAERVAAGYKRRGIPIHTFLAGTTNEMRDIIVEGVEVKREVAEQSPTRIVISLRSPGFEHQTIDLQILQNYQVVASTPITLDGRLQHAVLAFTPRQRGYQVYDVVAAVQPGEWRTENNHRRFGLEVINRTTNVIYLEGTPNEAGYLKNALEQDPYIKVKAMYHPSQGFPTTLEGLLEYDVVINSDIKKHYFSEEQLNSTVKLVEEYGGGFVMIGGFSAFGSGGYQQTIIDRITPVAMEEMRDYRFTPFHMRLPAEARTHPIMILSADPQENDLIWTRKLPPLYGYNRVDHAKPGAIVLAENPMENGPRGPMVILAIQEVGKGRTMAFTSDTTRAWGEAFETVWGERKNPALPLTEGNCDSRYYRQFWINAVRWLAAGRSTQTNSPLSLELTKSQCITNEKVTATIKVRERTGNELNEAEVSLLLTNDNGATMVFKPHYDETAKGYVADVHLAQAGSYTAVASAMLNGQSLGQDRQLLDCEEADLEMAHVRANPELLARLSAVSHGSVLSSESNDIAKLTATLSKQLPTAREYRRSPIWDNAWWLLALSFFLCSEWVIRRSRGWA